MDAADEALKKAWALADENYTSELVARFEELLPTLIQAGYVEAEGHTWRFTRRGFERANELQG